jgi:hypothetical protein
VGSIARGLLKWLNHLVARYAVNNLVKIVVKGICEKTAQRAQGCILIELDVIFEGTASQVIHQLDLNAQLKWIVTTG